MKEVILAKSAGFCFGVKRAVDTVYEQAKKENKPIVMISFSVDEAKVLYTPYEKEKLAEYIFNKISCL